MVPVVIPLPTATTFLPQSVQSAEAVVPGLASPSGTANRTAAKEPVTADANPVLPTAAPLQQLHATTSASLPTLPTISHSEEEKQRNLERQDALKDLGRLEARIGKAARDLKKARYQKNAEKCSELRQELRKLKKKKAELIPAIQAQTTAHSSSRSVSSEDSSDSSPNEEPVEARLDKIKDEIKDCKASLDQAKSRDREKQASRLEKKLEALHGERKRLESELPISRTEETSIQGPSKLLREDYEEVLQDLEECKSALREADKQGRKAEVSRLMREIQQLEEERNELASKLEATHQTSSSGSQGTKAADPDPVTIIKQQIDTRRGRIAEIDRLLGRLNRQVKMQDEVQEQRRERKALEEEAGHLESLLRFIESQGNAEAIEETVASTSTAPVPPVRTVSLSRVIHAAATRRRRSSMPAYQPPEVTVEGTTPLKALHEKSRNSTLLASGEVKKNLSEMALPYIERLDSQIDKLATNIDLLYETRRRQLGAGSPVGNSKARAQRRREIESLDKRILKGNLKLGKLIEEREKLEATVIPPEQELTAKEQAEQYELFVNRFKTAKTRELENKHAQRLADLANQQACCCGTLGLQLLGGWAANATSFFIGNSIARALAPSLAAPLVSVPVSAFLHVMVAGPVLKQVLDRTWSAPALAEFNNYFKLLGAAWGDWARGEENKKKYASKDPEKSEKLTIAERRAEQRPFKELLWDRYKTEEAGYYAYTINYGFKALAAAGLATAMDAGSSAYRWAEGGMHGLMAWISGAEYVVAMQEARSRIPGAKQIVLPDRATWAVEAEALQSRLEDLQNALEDLRSRTEKDPEDPTERNLLKAIRKTQKALNAASLRSELLGTFRYEFSTQFKTKESFADTVSESVGRTISLIPTAVLGEYLQPWRASGDFWQVFGAHALQGVLLIMPPGFTARPLYSGLIRAAIQAGINGKDDSAASRVQSSSSGRTPGDEDQGEKSIIVEVSSDSDDEGWKGNPRESDEDFW